MTDMHNQEEQRHDATTLNINPPTTDATGAAGEGARVTRPLASVAQVAAEPAEAVATRAPADLDATVLGTAVRVSQASQASRPRRSTLATITQPRAGSRVAVAGEPALPSPVTPSSPSREHAPVTTPGSDEGAVPDEIDEWSIADQPTVVMVPRSSRNSRPDFLETGEQHIWPVPAPRGARQADVQPVELPAVPRRTLSDRQGAPIGPRLASPAGRLMPPTPPIGVARATLANPRMERFQELRRQRVASENGDRVAEAVPVADAVRQWWSDLQPGLGRALHYQHEAKASGMHPIPAYEAAPSTRLGDAFGRIAAQARDLTERAQLVAGPTLKRLHDQAEQAAQALVDKIEGNQVRQQAPLLGPGRVAIFFRQGVTIGQAQRLLAASEARPMRIIPRKHGFLAMVRPGTEADIGEHLRHHPYVRDVVYLEYDASAEAAARP